MRSNRIIGKRLLPLRSFVKQDCTKMTKETIKEIDVQSVMTKSTLPVGGYSVNPYVGCLHACKYCYASFMKRFTGHTEPWGTFLDVKNWKPISNPHKYDGQRIVIGSVTDGYNPYEEVARRTRRLLEELRGCEAEIMICTKSDLVLRDLDLLKQFRKVTVSWSINGSRSKHRAKNFGHETGLRRRHPDRMFHLSDLSRNHRCQSDHRTRKGPDRPDMAGKLESERTVQGGHHELYSRKTPGTHPFV